MFVNGLVLLVLILAGCEHGNRASQRSRSDTTAKRTKGQEVVSFGETSVDLGWGENGPREAWSVSVGTGYGSPIVHQGNVIVADRIENSERLQAFRIGDGERVWGLERPMDFVCEYEYSGGPYSTPVVAEGRLYWWGGQGVLSCQDPRDGRLVWSRDLHREFGVDPVEFPAGASPLVHEGRLFLSLGGQTA
ncbi:MAG: PQQ-binding-like beta-propeller repeat protein, partial [Planctomycetota bacterium]